MDKERARDLITKLHAAADDPANAGQAEAMRARIAFLADKYDVPADPIREGVVFETDLVSAYPTVMDTLRDWYAARPRDPEWYRRQDNSWVDETWDSGFYGQSPQEYDDRGDGFPGDR